mmetsp:Transcript_36720/g.32941  ORF Transcript_36720/g.32941 Transcript_36720/m.32941 type:complete len:109 (-) Transcript_36720:5-331(-)
MEKENENNGIIIAKLLSDILKSTSHTFKFDQTLKKLFNILTEHSDRFYFKVKDIKADPSNQDHYQYSHMHQNEVKIIKSKESIKLITEIPNLFVYAFHFVDQGNDIVK